MQQDQDEAAGHGLCPHGSHLPPKEKVAATLRDLGNMKSWLVESMSSCFMNPVEASSRLRTLLKGWVEVNPELSKVSVDLGIDLNEESAIDFADFSQQLRRVEQEHEQILKDIEAAGTVKRRRGRPYGSKNKPKIAEEKEEEEGDTETCKETASKNVSKRSKRKKGHIRQAQNSKGLAEPGGPQEQPGDPPPSTDPFAEMEETKANKCSTISLYSKCLVVETALKLRAEGTVQNVEKEIMARFPHYFWSVQGARWKTGLLSKWCQCLNSNRRYLWNI